MMHIFLTIKCALSRIAYINLQRVEKLLFGFTPAKTGKVMSVTNMYLLNLYSYILSHTAPEAGPSRIQYQIDPGFSLVK